MKASWQTKKLGDICDVIAGQSPEGSFYNKTGEGLPFYQGKKEFTERYLGEPTTWTKKITKEAKEGDILMSVRAPVGPVNFSTDRICIGRGLASIRAGKDVDRNFLFDFLQMFESKIIGNAGAVFSSISKTQIENIEISLPPLPEQKRIVKKLDEVFEKVTKAKEAAEKNLQNAKELFESYLNNIFANPGKDWEEKKIGDVCNLMTGGTPSRSKKEYFEEGTIKWLVSGDVNLKEIFDCDGRITELGMKNSNTKYLPINSIIIALNGQGKTRGTVAMLRTKATCNQSLVSIYPKNVKELVPEFIYHNLNVRYQEIRKITGDHGNDRRGLNMPLIRNIKIGYPRSILEQERIVKKFNTLSLETKKLEKIYEQKLADLEELKKSILSKAFAGEL